MQHHATIRVGIVGPGEPGHRVFESNFVMECSCGRTMSIATTTRASAERVRLDHERTAHPIIVTTAITRGIVPLSDLD
jgi:hypothetical protein